jgi:hypothetical protein
MATTEDRLETLFAKVRALPKPRQELAVEALSEIADEETYTLGHEPSLGGPVRARPDQHSL